MEIFCNFIKKIDLYSKSPEFYYKGDSSKKSWIGIILTILYAVIYIAFLAYKLDRMINRVDVTFYDTNSYTGEIPSIHLTKENFYGAFTLLDPINNFTPYINPSVYTLDGELVSQVKVNGKWETTRKTVTFKPCQLSDFGSKYQKIFSKQNLTGYICPQDLDFVMEGYNTLDRYSYISMKINPCRNSSENNNICYPDYLLLYYLTATQIEGKIEDIELTPRDHDNPVEQLERDITGPTYKDLYQMIYVYMQLVIIETDDNIIGFEALSNTKTEKHLKYDTSWIVSKPIIEMEGNAFTNPSLSLNEITIQLSPTVLTQKRTYVQLIDVLGDVGGLMEIINMVFSVFCSFIASILYEISLVNNLFNFDLDKKIIILKEKKFKKIKLEITNEKDESKKNVLVMKSLNDNKKNQIDNNDIMTINKMNNSIIINNNNEAKKGDIYYEMKKINDNVKIRKHRKRTNSRKNLIGLVSASQLKSNESLQQNNNNHEKEIYDKPSEKKDLDMKKFDINENIENSSKTEKKKDLVDKIKFNKFAIHCGFCCVRSIQNYNNILLDEGLNIIMEQLDVFNIFRKLYIESKNQTELNEKLITTEMSKECQKNIIQYSNKINKVISLAE